jgi:hypothetical protein
LQKTKTKPQAIGLIKFIFNDGQSQEIRAASNLAENATVCELEKREKLIGITVTSNTYIVTAVALHIARVK